MLSNKKSINLSSVGEILLMIPEYIVARFHPASMNFVSVVTGDLGGI